MLRVGGTPFLAMHIKVPMSYLVIFRNINMLLFAISSVKKEENKERENLMHL